MQRIKLALGRCIVIWEATMPRTAAVVLYVALMTFLFALMPTRAHAANGHDVADLWWNPQESGWGLQLVQQSRTVFATLYVYDNLGVPMWYTALLSFIGLNATNGPIYRGQLFESRGPFWGGPYDPALATIAPIGTMTFNSPTTSTAVLTYVINGVTVAKNVSRFSLTTENFNGTYTGVYRLTTSGCSNPVNNGTSNLLTTFTISQNNSAMTIAGTMTDGVVTSVCTFSGNYTPQGSIGGFTGNYSCTSGETGTVSFAEMQAERFAIMGRISSGRNNLGCGLSGRFSATEN